jgi:diguanylate cyclase
MQAVDFEDDRRSPTDRRRETSWPVKERLVTALDRDEIEILFQPQFAADGKLLGAEALARWQSPTMGATGATELFAIAERADHVEPLTRHIARAALTVAAGWPERLRLSINVTAADVAQPRFAESIARKVAKAGFAPQRLTLEITEQSLLAELPLSAGRLRLLTDLGIRIALDDFGAGFCNFRYLKHLPLHYLKLDRSMVEGIDEDPRDLAVLRGILAMAQALELEVVAEGVERPAQLEAVVREGCAGWQGFLGAEPMTAGEFARLAETRGG